MTQTTAWKIKHKLKAGRAPRRVMQGKRLTGRIEIDDAYLGEANAPVEGEVAARTGKVRRSSPLSRTETTDRKSQLRVKLRRVTSFCATSIAGFAKRSLDPNWSVVSDGLQCFTSVADAGCVHQVVKTGSGPKAARTPAFKWVNTTLGNIKADHAGAYRAVAAACTPLPRRIRVPLQSPIRSRRHDPASHMGRRRPKPLCPPAPEIG